MSLRIKRISDAYRSGKLIPVKTYYGLFLFLVIERSSMIPESAERDLIINRDHDFRLFVKADGTYCIGVLCGSVAMYEVKVPLNSQEMDQYATNKEQFLIQLAHDICKHESKYADRSFA